VAGIRPATSLRCPAAQQPAVRPATANTHAATNARFTGEDRAASSHCRTSDVDARGQSELFLFIAPSLSLSTNCSSLLHVCQARAHTPRRPSAATSRKHTQREYDTRLMSTSEARNASFSASVVMARWSIVVGYDRTLAVHAATAIQRRCASPSRRCQCYTCAINVACCGAWHRRLDAALARPLQPLMCEFRPAKTHIRPCVTHMVGAALCRTVAARAGSGTGVALPLQP
jgi:hypothetical protein